MLSAADTWQWHWFAAALMTVFSASQIAMVTITTVSHVARKLTLFVLAALGSAAVTAAVGLRMGADAILARADHRGPGGQSMPAPVGLESTILSWRPHWTALMTALTVSTFLVCRGLRMDTREPA
jgi:hypothetical protein